MYASLWMLLRPFGAMKGWRGTGNEATGCAVAAVPWNTGAEPGPGRDGIGTAGMSARAGVRAAAMPNAVLRAVRLMLCAPGGASGLVRGDGPGDVRRNAQAAVQPWRSGEPLHYPRPMGLLRTLFPINPWSVGRLLEDIHEVALFARD